MWKAPVSVIPYFKTSNVFFKIVFNACPSQSVPIFAFWPWVSISLLAWKTDKMWKAGLQPGDQVTKAKFNQMFFSASVTVARTDPRATAAWQPLSPGKLRDDLHTVLARVLLFTSCCVHFGDGLALLSLCPHQRLVTSMVPIFVLPFAWCECLPTSLRMGYTQGSSWLSAALSYGLSCHPWSPCELMDSVLWGDTAWWGFVWRAASFSSL